MKKSITLLGSTGSIGVNTLNIAREFNIDVEVLAAGNNIELLQKQIDEFKPKIVVIGNEKLKDKIDHENVLVGESGILEAIEKSKSKIVVNALVGFLGLKPTLKAIELDKEVALANKETLVVAGKFIDIKKIRPIDSEHFGLWYVLQGKDEFEKLTITASGGAFRDWPLEKLKKASVKDALNHPNWSMGKKITIDSATMVNKLFELLEAKWLFSSLNVDALIETKSIIHAIVDFKDGSSLMHASGADMRLPIAYALLNKVNKKIIENIDFRKVGNLEFREIEVDRYPIWQIKDRVLKNPDLGVIVNASNEVAIKMFLEEKIGFLDISKTILKAVEKFEDIKINFIEDIFLADKEVRDWTRSFLNG